MSSDFDATEFIDGDFQAQKASVGGASGLTPLIRAPSREEVDSKVAEAQQRLVELKRAQEQLERERSALEETRRRQSEFQTGRQEMIEHLTRGLGLLEESEFTARRDAEQMAKTVAELREALTKVQAIHEETWTRENFPVELTRGLTTVENARMEWNAARLKFPVLSGQAPATAQPVTSTPAPFPSILETHTFSDLCRLGFALTWPVALALLALGGLLAALLLRR